jgi:DNA-binding transcriptional regulator PaaX
MKNYEHGELAKEILKGLALGGFIIGCIAIPNLAQVANLFNSRGWRDHCRVRQAVQRLQKKKLVRITNKNGKDIVEITELGKRKVLEYKLGTMQLARKEKWDGKWRIVMFDIPEQKKRVRNAISYKIKDIGMHPIQKSVFVFPYSCKDEIDFVGEMFGVRKNIIYIEAMYIEGADNIKRHFSVL